MFNIATDVNAFGGENPYAVAIAHTDITVSINLVEHIGIKGVI